MNLEKRKKKKRPLYSSSLVVHWPCVCVRVCVSVQSLSKQLEAVKA